MGSNFNVFFADEVICTANHAGADAQCFDDVQRKKVEQCQEGFFLNNLDLDESDFKKVIDSFENVKKHTPPSVSASRGLERLANLTSLTKLHLSGFHSETSFGSLSGLTQLIELEIHDCHSLKDLSALKNLSELELVNLRDCLSLTELEPLQCLKKLKRLNIHGTLRLEDKDMNELRSSLPNCRMTF